MVSKKYSYGDKKAASVKKTRRSGPVRMDAKTCIAEATKRMNAAGMHQKTMDSDGM